MLQVFVGHFSSSIDEEPDFPTYQAFHFFNKLKKVIPVYVADKYQINYIAVDAAGKIAANKYLLNGAKPFDNIFNNAVEANVFEQYVVNFPEQGMQRVGSIPFFVALRMGYDHSGIFKSIEFEPDGVRGFAKFCFQPAQVGRSIAVQKEL